MEDNRNATKDNDATEEKIYYISYFPNMVEAEAPRQFLGNKSRKPELFVHKACRLKVT
jgi:hypothetical protein